jgi:phosphate ABC transporter phosphate-binding protein
MRRVLTVVLAALALTPVMAATATTYVPISGAGSTWSQNALDQWRRNVNQYGMQVNYQGTGSSDGRNQFRNGTVDFAVSEIPYGLKDNGVNDVPPERKYANMPIVAGGTSFMYNLKIGGRRVTNLRLSGENVAKLFTGAIKQWNDPAIARDNPGLTLPARRVVPVVRSDGSGTTAQFTLWMSKQHPAIWDAYCKRAGLATPCGLTSVYPVVPGSGFVALSGSLGVSGYVAQSQSEGAITYVEYSYALNTGFPIAKVLNKGGYYVEPTASNVAVALLQARINTDASSPAYLTQILDGVYNNADSRAYPLSSYSYMVVPTATEGSFSTDKGRTLGAFAYYFLCEGQQQAPVLGYSPLPVNLVRAGLDQVRRIPGVDVKSVDLAKCNNPTFSPDGTNTLAKNAPRPQPCDKAGATQCATGTGGASRTPTAVRGATGTGTGAAGGAGGAGAAGAAGGTGTALATGTTGAAAGAGGAGAGGAVVDPDTGQLVGAGGTAGAGDVAAVPVAVGTGIGSGLDRVLVALAVLLLLGVTLGPPLLSRRLGRSSS